MQLKSLTCFTILILLSACNKDDNTSDFRTQYLGNFACTKSSQSFDDKIFVTETDVIIENDVTQDSVILLNGVPLPINADGSTGRISVEGNIYDLEFKNDSLYLFTHPDAIGLFPYCYIKGPVN